MEGAWATRSRDMSRGLAHATQSGADLAPQILIQILQTELCVWFGPIAGFSGRRTSWLGTFVH